MRLGIISDVHANLHALKAVCVHAKKMQVKPESWIFLGDAVGYGPAPVETIQLLSGMVKNPRRWFVGNHDVGVLGLAPLPVSEEAAFTQREHRQIIKETAPDLWDRINTEWTIKKANARRCIKGLDYWFCHAAFPRVPGIWVDQVLVNPFPWAEDDGFDRKESIFRMLESKRLNDGPAVYFHGHSHLPYAKGIVRGENASRHLPIQYADTPDQFLYQIREYDRIIFCAGSVGQPRNPDPVAHAAYGVLDTTAETFQFCRVPYNSEWVWSEMKNRGYPLELVEILKGYYPDNVYWKTKGKGTKYKWDTLFKESDTGWDVL